MTSRLVLTAVAALMVAGCQPANEQTPANTTTTEPANIADNAQGEGNVLATVLTMSDRERNVVFIRAIMDAGLPCQEVKASTRMPDQDGKPLWRADCVGGASHMISITPDGTANIITRTDTR
ncbi:hypothetical protein ACG3SL_11830 [Sphingomonas sp. CJ20]